jgi:hypothetical protein
MECLTVSAGPSSEHCHILYPAELFIIGTGSSQAAYHHYRGGRIVATKKKAGRWSGARQSGDAAAGRSKAESDRKLQQQAESRRKSKPASRKNEAVQAGARRYPESPLPKQHLQKPGLESELKPRPMYRAPEYRGSGKLEDKVALITGGDSGIGRAVAVLYAREGADVAIVYLSEEGDAEETRRAVEAEGRSALLLPGDVTDPSFCRRAVDATVREFGQLDILVNNAAFQEHVDSLEDLSEDQLDRTFKTNIYGYFHMAKAALPHLQEGSVIVNSGSVTGIEGSNPRIHQIPCSEPARERHSRELRRSRAGVDPAQPRGCGRREGFPIRWRCRNEARGTAGGDRPGVRLSGRALLLQLHHR